MPDTLVSSVLKIAAGEIGVHEVPPHSNTAPRIRQYQAATSLGGTGWPWCIAFIMWTFRQAGCPFPYRTASAYNFLAWAQKAGWTVPVPVKGAIAIWHVGSGHGSIIESFDLAKNTITTIDGNANDQVERVTRSRNLVAGFIWHPALARKPVLNLPAVKEPWWEVTTSMSGHKKLVFRGPGVKAQKLLPGWLKTYRLGLTIKRGKK